MKKNNTDTNQDPRNNPFYHWGLVSFTMAIIFITFIPAITHYFYVFPTRELFIIPATILFIFAYIAWQGSPDTQPFQNVIIGAGLIIYSVYQLLISLYNYLTYPVIFQKLLNEKNTLEINYVLLVLVTISGIALILSAYSIKTKSIRSSINFTWLFASVLLGVVIVFSIILRNMVTI